MHWRDDEGEPESAPSTLRRDAVPVTIVTRQRNDGTTIDILREEFPEESRPKNSFDVFVRVRSDPEGIVFPRFDEP